MLQVLKSKKGFTLVELLIVVVIIGILAVTVIPRLGKSTQSARDGQRKGALNGVAGALSTFVSVAGGVDKLPAEAVDSCMSALGTTLIPDYIPALPSDPYGLQTASCPGTTAKGGYAYHRIEKTGVVDGFVLLSKLESTNKDDNPGDGIICLSGIYSGGWVGGIDSVAKAAALDVGGSVDCSTGGAAFMIVQ